MSFADEVIASNTQRSSTPPPEAPPTPAVELKASAEPPLASPGKVAFSVEDMDFNTVLPVGGKVEAPVEAKPAAPEEPKQPMIRIGGVEFKSIEEAVKYADDLARAKEQEEAYLQGFQKAKEANEPQVPEKSIDEILEEKLFENPRQAIADLRKQVKEEIFAEYNKMMTEQAQATQQAQANEALWSNFYKENTELSDPDTREYIQDHLLKKHWDRLKDLPLTKSLPELAEMARKALKISKENALPSKELQSGPAIVAGSSGDATRSSLTATVEKELDFVSQINKLRKRSAK
jgi:glutamate synthase domain-containing protein 2